MTASTLDGATVAAVTRTMALPKVASADDIAAQVATLLSPVLAGHVTGQLVTVPGGMEARVLRDPSRRRRGASPQRERRP
jgi:3-oxoacyl-[acyl-carrier protein] reductase